MIGIMKVCYVDSFIVYIHDVDKFKKVVCTFFDDFLLTEIEKIFGN